MRVAVLGTGKMGAAIALRVDSGGHEVVLWNRTPERAREVGVGRVAATPAEAAAGADVVLSMLTGPEACREVHLGSQGSVSAAAGQVFVEMSTSGSDIMAELESALAERATPLVASPVLGSIPAVESGSLVLLAGTADAGALERARPVLSLLGDVHEVGSPAAAADLKLISNVALAVTNQVAAELLAAGERGGLSPDLLFWILARQMPYLKAREDSYLRGRHQPVTFALKDMVKDLDLALGWFRRARARVTLLELCRDEHAAAAAGSKAALEFSALVDYYRKAPA